MHGFGRESMLIRPASSTRVVTLSVSAVEADSTGAYSIELRRYADTEAAVIAAADAMTEAGRSAAAAKTQIEKSAAAVAFGAAASAWTAAGRPEERAHALHVQCELESQTGNRLAAIGHCEEAAKIWRASSDSRFSARVSTRLGLLYGDVGRSSDAADAHNAALRTFDAIGDRRGFATASVNLGLLLHYQGNLDGALKHYRAALSIYEPLNNHRAIANLANNIGGIHYMRGEASSAMTEFRRAIELQRRVGDREGEASALGNLASLQRNLGDLQAALATQLAVLDIRRSKGDRDGEGRALYNIGLVYLTSGDFEQARTYLNDALQIRHAAQDRVGEIATLRNLAMVEDELGHRTDALRRLSDSEALAEAAQMREAVASARLVGGSIMQRAGEYRAARVEFAAATTAFHELGIRRKEAESRLGESRSLLAMGDVVGARSTADVALSLVADTGYLPLRASAHVAIAKAELAAGRGPAASESVQSAIALIESIRGRIGTPELRASYAATVREAYELAVELALAREPAAEGAGASEALELAMRIRARTFNEMLGEPSLRSGPSGGAKAAALRAKYEQLSTEVGARDAAAFEGRTPANADRLRTDLDVVEAELRDVDPAFADLRAPRPLSARDLRDMLESDTTVLQYMVGERRSVLWVATRGSLRTYQLAPRRDLERLVRIVTDGWSRRVQGSSITADVAQLSRLVLPASALDGATEKLAIVADGPLEYLPFAALLRKDGSRVIEAHEIVMVPSITALSIQRRMYDGRGKASKLLAMVADPVFDRRDERAPSCNAAACVEVTSTAYPRLTGTEIEARTILTIAESAVGFTAYGVDASRESIIGGALRDHRIVHLATHGVLDSRSPRQTGLVFSRIGRDGQAVDGFLGLRDVAALELDADLVVLSACNTALGREIRGEGVDGLTRAFMHAGARRVLATLWRVPDRGSVEAMQRFYGALLQDGLPAPAALRRAQRELAKDRRWSDPYYWAAFTLHGEWRD